MERILLTCLFLSFAIREASPEKIGPAIVLPNRPSGQQTATASGKAARTTTVYGFLDFTTTIDNTVVAFKPSSAAPSTAASIQSSRGSETRDSKNTRLANDRGQLNTKIRPQPIASSASVDPGRPSSSASRKGAIKTGRPPAAEPSKTGRIAPTPTIGRAIPPEAEIPGGGLPARRGTPSSLAEKRRRFLALARRHKPEASSQRTSPLLRPRVDTSSANQDDQAQDQEMAETIEVSPSKVRRFQDLTNLSTFYAIPGSGNGTRERARILVRKLSRRPNERPAEGGKSRLLALRRSGPKNRLALALAGSRPRDVDQPDPDPVSSAAPPLTTLTVKDIAASSVSSRSFEPTSATIAEYLHESAEYGLDSNPYNSVLLPSLSSSSSADNDLPSSAQPDLQGSHSDSDLQLVSSLDTATRPLPVVKPSGIGDPGLTVPLQLSIVTSTFSSTETRLRTSLLPVYDGTSTTYYTLTHSFLVTKTVTTFQTVPPEEFMPYLIPGNDSYDSINDVFGDFSLPPPSLQRKSDLEEAQNEPELAEEGLPKELLEKSGSENIESNKDATAEPAPNPGYPMGNPLLGNLPFLNLLGPAAALGLNPYFPYGLGLPQVVTTSRPVFSTDVIFTSKLLPIIDGLTTSYHTVREPASTVTHTSFETFTTQVQGQHPLGLGANNLGQNLPQGGPQQVSTVTNPHTYVTTETETATQVFKLMYDGYKTSYRTVSSSTIVTRTIATFTTTTVPVYNQLMPFFG